MIPDKYITETLNNKTFTVNQLIELNGIPIILNCIPIIIKGNLMSAIITVQMEDDILSLDQN